MTHAGSCRSRRGLLAPDDQTEQLPHRHFSFRRLFYSKIILAIAKRLM